VPLQINFALRHRRDWPKIVLEGSLDLTNGGQISVDDRRYFSTVIRLWKLSIWVVGLRWRSEATGILEESVELRWRCFLGQVFESFE